MTGEIISIDESITRLRDKRRAATNRHVSAKMRHQRAAAQELETAKIKAIVVSCLVSLGV